MTKSFFRIALLSAVAFGCSGPKEETPSSKPSPRALVQGEQASVGPRSSAGVEPISVRLPIPIVEAGQTPFYVAADNGYYRNENLDVRFELGSPELNPVKMVASGSDLVGVLGGPDTLLVARSKGVPIRAIAVLHRNSNFPCLLTLKSSGITKVKQLDGKRVGFFHGHISTDVLRNLLHKEKVKYEEVDIGFDYSQLIAKKLDAQWAFTVTAGLELPSKGVDINVISPADYGIITHGYTIFVTEEQIQKQPEKLKRFLRATLLGVRDSLSDPEKALESLLKRDPKLDRELNMRRLRAYNSVTTDGREEPIGYMNLEMFQTTADRLGAEKVLATSVNAADAFTTALLPGNTGPLAQPATPTAPR